MSEWSVEAQMAMNAHDQLGGPGHYEVQLAEYRALARKVEHEGPRCVYCNHRGLNLGRFAQGDVPIHIGCAIDYAQEQLRDEVVLEDQ